MTGDDEQELIKLFFPPDFCVCFSSFSIYLCLSHTPSFPPRSLYSSSSLWWESLFHNFLTTVCLLPYFLLLLFAATLCPHYPIYLSIHQNYPIFPFNNIVPYSQAAVVEMDFSCFAEILQVSGCPWHINKLPPDEEKCKVLLSHFPQALEYNFALIMLL